MFLSRLKRLFRWIPIIWKTDDYDYRYSLEIFKYSLEELEYHILDHGIHATAENDAKEIRFAINLLNRKIKDEYIFNHLVTHRRLYGDGEWILEPCEFGNCVEWKGVKYSNDPVVQQKAEKEYSVCSDRARWSEENDWKTLFSYLEKNMRGWWC